jgi:hypothetical protein
VEILKFAEPPKRSSRTNTKKRGGIMPLLAVVVSVAVVGGMSTTLAGTINLNSAGSVEFGQGVVTTAACDTSISIVPASAFETSTSTFSVATVTLDRIGIKSDGSDTATAGAGCLGKYMTIRAYNVSGEPLNLFPSGTTKFAYVQIPSDSGTASTAGGFTTLSSGLGVSSAAGFSDAPQTKDATGGGNFTMSGLKISGTVTRITLESSDAAPTA